jgi:hypothetical protein
MRLQHLACMTQVFGLINVLMPNLFHTEPMNYLISAYF